MCPRQRQGGNANNANISNQKPLPKIHQVLPDVFADKRIILPRLLLANVRSLRYITDELSIVLQTNNIDICCLTETWLTADIETSSIDIHGYVCYRCDRSDGRQGGGVACYVREDQPFSLIQPTDRNAESLWILYRQPHMPRSMSHILFSVVYHPPNANHHVTSNHIVDNVDAVIRQHPNAGIMITGDFNRMPDKSLRDLTLKQIVKVTTRKAVTLDKIYTNIGDWYSKPVSEPGIANSDHQAIIVTPILGGHPITASVRSKDHNSKILLAHHLAKFDWSLLYEMSSTESMVEYFYHVTTSLLDYYLPVYEVKRYSTDKPWVTDQFRRLIRQRQYAWRSNNVADYHRCRNAINRLSKSLKKTFYQNKIDGLRNCDSTNWWKRTKLLTGQTSKPELLGLANALTGGDVKLLANTINDSLIRVSADLNRLTSIADPSETDPEASFEESDFTISPEAVFRRLEKINIRKAPGPDNLPNWFLRDFAFALCNPLCCIFNSSLQEGVMPAIWKQADVVPIPKTKPPKSVEQDLRPISLTPTLSKVLESLVGRFMLNSIGDNFDRKQFGALKGRSTSHELVDIFHKWHRALDQRQSVRVVFVDYAKAFDHVDHGTVLNKLHEMGIPPKILRWLSSFLLDRKQRVKIGRVLSEWARPNGGMPQGTWLGPYVFLALINDLSSLAELHKFVDDCTLSETITTPDDTIMQQEIDSLNNWSTSNCMNINTKKTKEMLLGPIRNKVLVPLLLNNSSIERVHSYKLLGLNINDKMKWNEHVSAICRKAATRLHFLKLLKRAQVSVDDMLHYYQAVIRPVTEYACVVWNSSLTKAQSNQLESIQHRALKIIHNNNNTDIQSTLRELPLLSERRDVLTRSFFAHVFLDSGNCLHHLLPQKRDNIAVAKLRNTKQYLPPIPRTERFKKSAVFHALQNYDFSTN